MPALSVRRKAALDGVADSILAEQDSIEAAAAAREQAAQAAAVKRKQQLKMALEDKARYCEVVAKQEAALDLFEALEKERNKIAGRLMFVPGLASFLSMAAWGRRFGDHLSRRLFGLYRTGHLGRLTLNAGGNYMASSLAGNERAQLDRIFQHEYGDEK